MRKLQLDLLRALAIVLVLGHHMSPAPPELPALVQDFLSGWRKVGWIGVDLFFVLSGFLISGLLYKEYAETGGFHLGRFLVRRGLKIYPSYYAFLVLSLPAIAWMPGVLTPKSFCSEALFVSNYFDNIWGHTWTLCVEEHFYLLLALSFFIATSKKAWFKYFIPGCILFLVLPLCLRWMVIHQIPYHEKPHYAVTAFRLDALTFGVLLSYFYHQHEQKLKAAVKRFSLILVPIGFALIFPCALGGHEQLYLYTFGLTALYMGWGLLLLVAMSYDLQTKNKLIVLLAQVGVFSYSIYLWHKPFSGLCSLPSEWWPGHLGASARLLTYFVGSLTVGILMSKGIEWPVLRLRDRLFPSRYSGVGSVPIPEPDTLK